MMTYNQAVMSSPGMSGSINMPGASHVAHAASSVPRPSQLFSAADYRNELARVKRVRKRNVVLIVLLVLIAAGIAAFVFLTGASATTVKSTSMAPVLAEGECVITVKAGEVRTGSVVAYRDSAGELQFGRVVAEPGDWVSVAPDGTVAVSEEALSVESAKNVFGTGLSGVTTRVVPDGSYYVLGDAENATADGLSTSQDFVASDQVVGKPVARVWPITSVGLVS